jgi:AMP nucleosidase
MTQPSVVTPSAPHPESFRDPKAAVAQLIALYTQATDFLCEAFSKAMVEGHPGHRYRAFYPEVRMTTQTFAKVDSRLSFGHVSSPGKHAATISRPDLFAKYLEQQIGLLIENHDVSVTVGVSQTPIPVHFAVANDTAISVPQDGAAEFTLRDVFDVPDLSTTNDDIVNGTYHVPEDGTEPLAPFTAQRVRRPIPAIFRTMCCLPTTSSTSPSSRPMRARSLEIRRAATPVLSAQGMSRLRRLMRRFPRLPRCRKCRPII